jgi:hypothetical protein
MVNIIEFHNLLDQNKWSGSAYSRGTWNIPITEGNGILRKVRFRNFESVPYTQYAMAKKETVEITINPVMIVLKDGKVDFDAIDMFGYNLFIGDPVSKMMIPIGVVSKMVYLKNSVEKFVDSFNGILAEWQYTLPQNGFFAFTNNDVYETKLTYTSSTIGSLQQLITVNNDLTFNEKVFSLLPQPIPAPTEPQGDVDPPAQLTGITLALCFVFYLDGHPITNIYSAETTSVFNIISKISEIAPQSGNNWDVTNII